MSWEGLLSPTSTTPFASCLFSLCGHAFQKLCPPKVVIKPLSLRIDIKKRDLVKRRVIFGVEVNKKILWICVRVCQIWNSARATYYIQSMYRQTLQPQILHTEREGAAQLVTCFGHIGQPTFLQCSKTAPIFSWSKKEEICRGPNLNAHMGHCLPLKFQEAFHRG